MAKDLLECGHKESPHGPYTRGYGVDKDGNRHCYECCAERDRADMIATGRATMYLTDGYVTNWPGSLKYRTGPIRTGRHNMAGKRYDTWFHGPDGFTWHAVQYGDNTQIVHCKRTRERTR
jgi:hypothetical protein